MQPTTRISPDALRVFVYDRIIGGGSVPSSSDIALNFAVTAEDARAELASLKIGKTLLVDFHPSRSGRLSRSVGTAASRVTAGAAQPANRA
jgi:hypothetical protein